MAREQEVVTKLNPHLQEIKGHVSLVNHTSIGISSKFYPLNERPLLQQNTETWLALNVCLTALLIKDGFRHMRIFQGFVQERLTCWILNGKTMIFLPQYLQAQPIISFPHRKNKFRVVFAL